MPAIRGQDSKKKTRRHTRDLDQIHDDIHKEKHLEKYKETKHEEDLPGLGQFYCVECAKWFESEANLTAHTKGKVHKRRVRALKEKPYSQAEADAAGGRMTWIDNGKPKEDNQELEMAEAT